MDIEKIGNGVDYLIPVVLLIVGIYVGFATMQKADSLENEFVVINMFLSTLVISASYLGFTLINIRKRVELIHMYTKIR